MLKVTFSIIIIDTNSKVFTWNISFPD